MAATVEILTLPDEPQVPGAIVEILDGQNQGNRYRRDGDDRTCADQRYWRLIHPNYPGESWNAWSWIWWAVTEDGSGGSQVRVTVPDPADPHPLPWTTQAGRIWDANGEEVCPELAVAKVNELGQP